MNNWISAMIFLWIDHLVVEVLHYECRLDNEKIEDHSSFFRNSAQEGFVGEKAKYLLYKLLVLTFTTTHV
jgi:hypothetical protein